MSSDCLCRNDREARVLETVFRRTRIENRHLCVPHELAHQWVPVSPRELPVTEATQARGPTTAERMRLYAEHAGPLSVRAAESALRSANLLAGDVTHLVTVSCTGFDAPGVDVELVDRIGLPPTVQRIHVGFMGCHGVINGLRAALGLIANRPDARVLLSATELCSLHFCCSWDPDRLLGNALFADGSASLVCGAAEPDQADAWRVVDTGSFLFRDSRDAITWRVGDHGFEMSLSSRVPDLIREHLGPWLESWLEKHDLSIQDIGSWAIHPGGPRIIDAVVAGLGLPADAADVSREILTSHGNMSSPTILFILDRLRNSEASLPCVALGFGPGLFAEAALIR